jgi:hypothetical protein
MCQSSFEDILHRFRLYQRNPAGYISTTIGELKVRTELLREAFKLEIDAKANQLLGELDEYEKECHVNATKPCVANELRRAGEYVKRTSDKLDALKLSLASSRLDEWQNIRMTIDQEKRQLEESLNEFKESLLMQKKEDYDLKLAEFMGIQPYSRQE